MNSYLSIIILIICSFVLSSCFNSTPKTKPNASLLATSNSPSTELTFHATSHKDILLLDYSKLATDKKTQEGSDLPQILFTSLETCPAKSDTKKLAGQARQLLVGFENLSIVSQTIYRQAHEIAETVALADSAGRSTALVYYTLAESNCLIDYTFFSAVAAKQNWDWWEDAEFVKHLRAFVGTLHVKN